MAGMKIAAVLDRYTVAINQGRNHGIIKDDRLVSGEAIDVFDPETGDLLGRIGLLHLRVIDVYPRFCVAETYRLANGNDTVIHVEVGDEVRVVGQYDV